MGGGDVQAAILAEEVAALEENHADQCEQWIAIISQLQVALADVYREKRQVEQRLAEHRRQIDEQASALKLAQFNARLAVRRIGTIPSGPER